MSYVAIVMQQGTLARTLELDPNARINGYPGYSTEYLTKNSIRSILYEDSTGVYLSREKKFKLTNVRGFLIFSSNPSVEPYIPKGIRYRWSNNWANQMNSNSTKENLLWPFDNFNQVLDYISRNNIQFLIKTDPFDDFVNGALLRQTGDRLSWRKENGTYFTLLKRFDKYILRTENGEYNRCWNTYGSCRISTTSDINLAIPFDIRYDGKYRFSYNGIPITRGGTWSVGFFQFEYSGAEFFPLDKNISINILIDSNRISDRDIYLLSGGFVNLLFNRTYNIESIIENMPTGITCDIGGGWNGTNLLCDSYRTPYTPDIGFQQCTTLDDFSNDQHCTLWAKEYNPKIVEERLKFLCQTYPIDGPNNDICKCYFPDDLYFDRIKENVSERVASGIKATNILQCASGLCTQDGSFSADIFYRGSRRCDLCVQVMSTNINAEQIRGNVTLQQLCTQVDASFTWQNLISDLRRYGTYQIGQPQETNIFKHVIISSDGLSIKLLLGSTLAKNVVQESQFLKFVPKDKDGNIIITQAIWNRSPTTYSNEILSFFLNARE